MTSGWHTTREYAEMKLPGVPKSERRFNDFVKKSACPSRAREARGGGLEYSVAGLPEAARAAYWKKSMASEPLPVPVSSMHPVPAQIQIAQAKDWQRNCAEARMAVLNEVRRLAQMMHITAAREMMVEMASSPPEGWALESLVRVANARAGASGERTVKMRTLIRWQKDFEQHGFAGLLPGGKPEDLKAKPWHAPLLALYQRPQKPSLHYAMELLHRSAADKGVTLPSYHQARRFLTKMSVIEVNQGRMGQSAMREIKPFVRRDTSKLLPGDIYVFDGHTFDAEIAHPSNGKPLRPELTWGIDGATRLCVGFSVGLAESAMVVMDAIRHACETRGPCAIMYSDRGSGERNKHLGDPDIGLLARLGITQKFGKARNPQAHGIIERAHQTIWVDGARQFDTFINASMDSDAKRKVFKMTRRDVKVSGTSPLLMTFWAFAQWCQQRVDWYNNRPHRSLPRVVDADGVRRHMTPNEAWKRGVEEGADVEPIKAEERDDLFRPRAYRTAARGEINLFGNRYFHADLAHFAPGIRFCVGYDIHDASKVWVRDPNGRLICIAKLDGNKRDYFPVPVVEQARMKRAQSRKARLHLHLQDVEDELNPPALLEHQQAEVLELNINRINEALAEPVLIEEPVPAEVIAAGRPMFSADYLKYEWLMANPAKTNGDDDEWIAWFRTGDDWHSLYRAEEEKAAARPTENPEGDPK